MDPPALTGFNLFVMFLFIQAVLHFTYLNTMLFRRKESSKQNKV